jgi:hypothetical protein
MREIPARKSDFYKKRKRILCKCKYAKEIRGKK